MKQTSRYYLQHSGIVGMKWGKRNGPPYPLNYSDLSSEEKEQAKQKAVRSGNITEAVNNIDHFTDSELRQLKERFKLDQEVKSLAAESVNTGEKVVDATMNKIGKVTKWAETGIKAYDTTAKLHNAFSKNGKKWTLVNSGNNKNNNKNDNGN